MPVGSHSQTKGKQPAKISSKLQAFSRFKLEPIPPENQASKSTISSKDQT
jgi:hypothetical protein